ncbi:MAG TPA: hypothetical protein VEW71_10000 [Allosphingosinicella sp.]|nr:hypothetical protein [Allosphingosinicella sp.]
MTSFPGSPRLLKGALVGVDPMNPAASIVAFQYNPDTMTRKLEARSTGGGEKGEAFRLTGAPKETITLSIEIDATDALEEGNPIAIATGISPTLAALEMMLYPKSLDVIRNMAQSAAGMVEIQPATGPMILLVWGLHRVLPVRIASFSITEQAYDPLLNPILAKVDLTLNVLSYNDLNFGSAGHALFLVHHVAKEVMATTNVFNSAAAIGEGLKL